MSDNIHRRFSMTLEEIIDDEEEDDEKQRQNVRDMFADAGFSHTGSGKRAICADCHLKPRPCNTTNLLGIHSECMPNCPFVQSHQKALSNQEQTVVAAQTAPGCDTDRRQSVARRTRKLSTGERLSILRGRNLCQVCKVCPRRIMFAPCNHFYSCTSCAEEVEKCMRCHKSIYSKIDIYRS